jgi:hypothetical protein
MSFLFSVAQATSEPTTAAAKQDFSTTGMVERIVRYVERLIGEHDTTL